MKTLILFDKRGKIVSVSTPGEFPGRAVGIKPKRGEKLLETEIPKEKEIHEHHSEILKQFRVKVTSGKPALVRK